MTQTTLAPATMKRFLEYAADAGNWSGIPLIGGNVGGDPADKGYIVNMKKAGLIRTVRDGSGGKGNPLYWMCFTEAGMALAAEHGITIEEL